MEQILQAIRIFENKYHTDRNSKIVVFLTKETIKKILKQQVELGITEDEYFDFTKEKIVFGGHLVKLSNYNSVCVITDEILLPDNIMGE